MLKKPISVIVTLTKIAKNQAPKRGVGSSKLLVEARRQRRKPLFKGVSVFFIFSFSRKNHKKRDFSIGKQLAG